MTHYPDGGQMLFAFGLPIILVWWQERRRARKVLDKLDAVESKKQGGHSNNTAPNISNQKNGRKPSIRTEKHVASPSKPPKPPKQDYAEIVRAGQTAAPALFDLGEQIEKLEDVSANYQTALMELALASFVAHADGRITDAERKALEAQIGAVGG